MNRNTIASIILAAGRGRRMETKEINKVTMPLADKPMIAHIVDFMRSLSINVVIVVVGYAKESVIEVLNGYNVVFAEQTEQLGTGHAVTCALEQVPPHIQDVFIVYGDDAVLYAEKHVPTLNKLFERHKETNAAITFLTIEQYNPAGLGRIVRDTQGNAVSIVEEKDATNEQKEITEINPGCFVFSVDFLKEYLPKIEKSLVTGEYYLTTLIDLAFKNNERVESLQGGKMAWRGVNTKEELQIAEQLLRSVKSTWQ